MDEIGRMTAEELLNFPDYPENHPESEETITTDEVLEFPEDPDYDPEEWERKRREEEEAKLAPMEKAAAQRRESAEIIAEHDEMLAEMLFEMTMNEMEV